MKNIYNLILIAVATLSLASCSDDDFLYQDQARVRLVGPKNYTSGTDSLKFSFATYTEETTEMNMDIDVCVMGTVADHDRTANVTIDESQSTASSDLYVLPTSVVVKAGESKGILPITMKRSTLLQEKSVKLYIKVQPSNDFAPGVNEENHILVIWNDMVSKPTNWDELEEFFGDYSTTKYRFMIANAGGITGFDTDMMSWAELQSYKIKFVNALNKYNEEHPDSPLRDENGVLVTF